MAHKGIKGNSMTHDARVVEDGSLEWMRLQIAALRAEIDGLRQLLAARDVVHEHHFYPPQPVKMPEPEPCVIPWTQTTCRS